MAEYVYGERLIDVSGTDDGPWLEKRVVPERRERIVRCRDCMNHFSHLGSTCCGYFSNFEDGYYVVIAPDGFCAWGEERDA